MFKFFFNAEQWENRIMNREYFDDFYYLIIVFTHFHTRASYNDETQKKTVNLESKRFQKECLMEIVKKINKVYRWLTLKGSEKQQ